MDCQKALESQNVILRRELNEIKGLLKMSLRVDNYDTETRKLLKSHMINFETIEFDFAKLYQVGAKVVCLSGSTQN